MTKFSATTPLPAAPMTATAPLPPSRLASRFNLAVWAILVVANLLDVLASDIALALGAQELNPLMALLLAQFGIAGMAVFKGLLLLTLLLLLQRTRGWTQWLMGLACTLSILLTIAHIHYLSPYLA